ncbi:copper amine oxidase N-terminal domain-containing protein [Paenibacillus sp. GCM10027626]|uniref:copper amine oxidase N-terminal domain-containing protein n=1 Tax=Paenibacillus sp. GCM10027626 TaxID=3273411 RepID=UPI00364375CF
MNKKMIGKVMAAGLLTLLVAATQLGAMSEVSVAAANSIEIMVNGKKATPDAPPYSNAGRVMVPLRFISDHFQGKLKLSGKDITITRGDRTIKLKIGSKTAEINGKSFDLGAPSEVKYNRTMVPLRLINAGFGIPVRWDAVGQRVWVGEEKVLSLEEKGVKVGTYDEYKRYFGDYEDISKTKKVSVFTGSDFPVRFEAVDDKVTFYKIWTEQVNGLDVIKIHHSGKRFGIYFLTGDGKPRFRMPAELISLKNADGSYVDVYYVASSGDFFVGDIKDKNWENFKISSVKYIGFKVNLETTPLLLNPFTK